MTRAEAFFASLPIPIIQAPMVGASSRAMTIAVSRAGGLGSVGAGAMSPVDIEGGGRGHPRGDRRALRGQPIRAGAGAAGRGGGRGGAGAARALVRGARPGGPGRAERLRAGFRGPVRRHPARRPAGCVGATFGAFRAEQVQALRARDVSSVVGTATSVAEARVLGRAGRSRPSSCAQGGEAGGHRGTFLAPREQSLIGTVALVPLILQATGLPVIAAGGIMDGRGVAAGLALGAAAAQMGTAFLLSDETAISPPWRRAIGIAGDDPTRVTRAFSGRYARGIENDFMRRMRPLEAEVPDYPVQNRQTRPLRAAAGRPVGQIGGHLPLFRPGGEAGRAGRSGRDDAALVGRGQGGGEGPGGADAALGPTPGDRRAICPRMKSPAAARASCGACQESRERMRIFAARPGSAARRRWLAIEPMTRPPPCR